MPGFLVFDDGNCTGCQRSLEKVSPTAYHQYVDALDLVFIPGWGEKIDGDTKVQISLCSDCADKLFEVFPRLKWAFEQCSEGGEWLN